VATNKLNSGGLWHSPPLHYFYKKIKISIPKNTRKTPAQNNTYTDAPDSQPTAYT